MIRLIIPLLIFGCVFTETTLKEESTRMTQAAPKEQENFLQKTTVRGISIFPNKEYSKDEILEMWDIVCNENEPLQRRVDLRAKTRECTDIYRIDYKYKGTILVSSNGEILAVSTQTCGNCTNIEEVDECFLKRIGELKFEKGRLCECGSYTYKVDFD